MELIPVLTELTEIYALGECKFRQNAEESERLSHESRNAAEKRRAGQLYLYATNSLIDTTNQIVDKLNTLPKPLPEPDGSDITELMAYRCILKIANSQGMDLHDIAQNYTRAIGFWEKKNYSDIYGNEAVCVEQIKKIYGTMTPLVETIAALWPKEIEA
jgi:hypothetical protein